MSEILTKEETDDFRANVLQRKEVSMETIRAAVRFLRGGRETAKPKEKPKKLTISIDDLLGLSDGPTKL
mgnify:FL=1